MYRNVLPALYICVTHVLCSWKPEEGLRPWSYRSWASLWVLGPKPGFSALTAKPSLLSHVFLTPIRALLFCFVLFCLQFFVYSRYLTTCRYSWPRLSFSGGGLSTQFLCHAELFYFMEPHLSIFWIDSCASGVLFRSPCLCLYLEVFLYVFVSTVSTFRFDPHGAAFWAGWKVWL